jgi:hypothetical protein
LRHFRELLLRGSPEVMGANLVRAWGKVVKAKD